MNHFPYPIMIQKKEDQMEVKEGKHNDFFKYAATAIAFLSAILLAVKGFEEMKKIVSIVILFIMAFCLFASFFVMSLLSK